MKSVIQRRTERIHVGALWSGRVRQQPAALFHGCGGGVVVRVWAVAEKSGEKGGDALDHGGKTTSLMLR